MKNKSIALLLGAALVLTSCGTAAQNETISDEAVESTESGDTTQEETSESASENTVTGTVVSVEENAITVSVKDEDGETEDRVIPLADSVIITKGGMGQPGNGGGERPEGEAPDGEAGEKPDGEPPSGEAGEKPDGEAPDGEAGKKPEGEAPDGEAGEKPDGEAPDGEAGEKPDGEPPSGEAGEKPDDEAPDEKPDEKPDGMPGDMGDGESETISLSDIAEGDMVVIELDDDGNAVSITVQSADMGGGMGQPGGMGQSGVDSYDAVNDYTEDAEIAGKEITSTGTDENAILVENGANVTVTDTTIDRTSAESTGGDNSSFYGVGAAALVIDGTLSVSGSTITTDAAGGAGIFAYGDGTAYVADSTINTSQDTSGGIHAAGGGTLYAWDLNVTTQGESAAAIRSDRGGGTMVVDGGTYTSNGSGSPAVYCTADIAIQNAELTANGSEAVCIEGLNSLRLYDCDLTGTMSDDERNDCIWNVIIYQSMSGDSELGNGTFEMCGGTLTAENGGLFYTTNTECTIILNDVEIIPADDNEFFLRCSGNNNQRGWGQSGSNGSDCLFTAIEQEMTGDVIWDSISTLAFYMTDGSSLTGAFVNDETYAGNGGDGYCNLYIDADSVWTVTGDSTVTSLSAEGSIVDANGKTVSIVGTDGTVYVDGDSQYTVTVESYSSSVDLSGASQTTDFADYAVERPEGL